MIRGQSYDLLCYFTSSGRRSYQRFWTAEGGPSVRLQVQRIRVQLSRGRVHTRWNSTLRERDNQGPLSLTFTELIIEINFSSKFDYDDPVRLQYCTCYNHSAVVSNAKLWSDLIIIFHIITTCILIHWGRVTHICSTKLTIIGSDNGLSPGRRQAIIWTNAGILLIGALGTNISEILSKIYTFSLKKMHLKMSSGKWRPSCLGLNVLMRFTLWAH